jgi:hypothetical protein
MGLGSMALASLLDQRLWLPMPCTSGALNGIANLRRWYRAPSGHPVYMAGGPSQLESFDHKPKLAEMDGLPVPESITGGQPIAQLQNAKLVCMRPQFDFARRRLRQEISRSSAHREDR